MCEMGLPTVGNSEGIYNQKISLKCIQKEFVSGITAFQSERPVTFAPQSEK